MLRDHGSAEPFLRQMAEELPDCLPEVSLAADCYGEVTRLRDKISSLPFGHMRNKRDPHHYKESCPDREKHPVGAEQKTVFEALHTRSGSLAR